MAEADWTELGGSLAIGTIDRGVTAGITPPAGGGPFVYGYNSLNITPGAHGMFVNLTNFAPTAKGARIIGCIRRGLSGGPVGFSPFLFVGLGGTDVSDQGYLLGLGDGSPSHIILRKGTIAGGVPDVAAPGSGVLRRSTGTVAVDEWRHLRLDMIFNGVGDVRLQVFENDLTLHPLGTAPTWTAIPGMAEFVDDSLGINSGSAPFTTGRCGWAFCSSDVTRRAFFKNVEVLRQL
jgi:hypothetical protein